MTAHDFLGIPADLSLHPRDESQADRAIQLAATITGKDRPHTVHYGGSRDVKVVSWSDTWAPTWKDRHNGPSVVVFVDRSTAPQTWEAFDVDDEGPEVGV